MSAAPSAAAGEAGFGERLAGLARRAGLDLAYLSIGGLTAVLAFCVWVTAASVVISLIIFIIGLPLYLLSVIAFRWTAELDRRNAALLLGRPLRATYKDHRGESFLARLSSTTRDKQTWKDLGWLVAHSVLGFTFAVVAVSLVASVIAFFTMPLWYWSVSGGVDWGLWNIDNLPLALLATVLAFPLAAVTYFVDRWMARGELWLAMRLLDGEEVPAGAAPAAGDGPQLPLSSDALRRMIPAGELSLAVHAAISGLIGLFVTVIWAAAGAGYYWPAWVWLGLLIPLSLHFGLREAVRLAPERRGMAILATVSLVIVGVTIAVWALTGFGTFWPIWTILGLIVIFVVVLLAQLAWRQLYGGERERELTERVETLTETRRGALDVQAAELRRIERDLHDGAQARLVALSMQLGRAEEGLADRPEIAALVRQARSEATAANAELRDLARGIAPPVLSDRGLAAAVEALGTRAPIPVTVEADISRRPAPVVESAAYFVVAESLTNVAKHAPGASAKVTLRLDDEVLDVTVADDGPGGAALSEGGGLDGLRRRVAALDGEMRIVSPAEGGTRIEVRLPCGS